MLGYWQGRGSLYFLLYVFYLSKYYELLDTALLIVKKVCIFQKTNKQTNIQTNIFTISFSPPLLSLYNLHHRHESTCKNSEPEKNDDVEECALAWFVYGYQLLTWCVVEAGDLFARLSPSCYTGSMLRMFRIWCISSMVGCLPFVYCAV